jgi:hypothetical protein
MSGQFVALVGDIVDGVTVFGPFGSDEEAQEWCDRQQGRYNDWHTVALETP